jgi:FKBP-type peptidyl-prolyl cis-trans isomerase FklB
MKKVFILASAFANLTATAQKKPAPAAKKTPVSNPSATSLKSLSDSASYAIGISVANFYTQQGMSNLNPTIVAKAINDVMSKKKVLLNDAQANSVIMQCMNEAQSSKAKPNITAGENFLAQNKKKASIKTTASGLQYEIVREGSGRKPLLEDSVTVHYSGTLINGTEFDNSYKRGEPITFPVRGVIPGWTEALQLMSEGAKYKLYIPYQLAYGTNDVGAIPAGSVLVFEVELIKVGG